MTFATTAWRIDEPKGQALFEASAEVPQDLQTAFSHDERGSELRR